MNILVINAGSSTIKFKLFKAFENEYDVLAKGHISRVGCEDARFKFSFNEIAIDEEMSILSHQFACEIFMQNLKKYFPASVDCIAYRVVHGGDFLTPQDAFETKDKVFELANKFTKAHAQGLINTVNYFLDNYKNIAQYFDFDTLYNMRAMAPECYTYALPKDMCKALGIRKYGEHGLSHQYIAEHSKKIFGDNQVVISCHLGSGSSISCIYNGHCFDNSMGLTPLAGVIMSTRCGNIDPSVITYMMAEYNLTPDEMDKIMNLESGLKAICGEGDMQKVVNRMQNGDEDATLAFKIAVNSYVKFIGGKIMQIGDKVKSDLSNLKIVFTAGIGENSALVRQKVVDKMSYMNIFLDKKMNNNYQNGDCKISSKDSKAEVWILPTDEEIIVAKEIYNMINE